MCINEYIKLLGKSPKVTDEPITKIINNQLDVKLGQFTEEEHDAELNKIKSTAAGVDEIPLEVKKARKFDDIFLRL